MTKSKLNLNIRKDKGEGIWHYSSYLAFVLEKYRLSLNEGNTPEIPIEEELILKREDLNPTGSLKDRGMAFLISLAYSKGLKKLVISSSGNAAISAAKYCEIIGLDLNIFVSPKISEEKRKALQNTKAVLHFSGRTVSDSIKFAKENNFFNLRPSTNEFGPEAYQTIAFETLQNQGLIEDIFIPSSSGVSLMGIAKGFKKFGLLPRIHVCQSSAVCPIAAKFVSDFKKEEESLAKALVAKTTPLRDEIIKTVKESGGTGWVIANQEIVHAQKILAQKNIETSEEGALALAAAYKARQKEFKLGKTVCLLTGKKYK